MEMGRELWILMPTLREGMTVDISGEYFKRMKLHNEDKFSRGLNYIRMNSREGSIS